jgi:hypothetical protein
MLRRSRWRWLGSCGSQCEAGMTKEQEQFKNRVAMLEAQFEMMAKEKPDPKVTALLTLFAIEAQAREAEIADLKGRMWSTMERIRR